MKTLLGFAPKTTRFIASTTAATIFTGKTVKIWGFVVQDIDIPAGNPPWFTIQTNESTPTVILTALISGAEAGGMAMDIPFIADKGLQILAERNDRVAIVFYHSIEGA